MNRNCISNTQCHVHRKMIPSCASEVRGAEEPTNSKAFRPAAPSHREENLAASDCKACLTLQIPHPKNHGGMFFLSGFSGHLLASECTSLPPVDADP